MNRRNVRGVVVFLASIATALAFAGAALGATLTRTAGGIVVFSAAAGETNDVDIFVYPTTGANAIGDANNTITDATGSGCVVWFLQYWDCANGGMGQPSGFKIVLGDGNDILHMNAWGTAGNCDPPCTPPAVPLKVRGGAGNDVLNGGAKANFLTGEAGNDTLIGGPDEDVLAGGLGNDALMSSDSSADDLFCGSGLDVATSDPLDAREACEPTTSITGHPGKKTSRRSATFAYTSNTPGAAFLCKLDSGPWASCPSTGITYRGLGRTAHTVSIRAKDVDGTLDPTPATYSWRVT